MKPHFPHRHPRVGGDLSIGISSVAMEIPAYAGMTFSFWGMTCLGMVVIATFLFSATAAHAQVGDIAKKHDSSQPIKITADNLEVEQDKHVAIFTGNVIAVQGETTLKSEIMKVHYRSNSDNAAAPGRPAAAPKPANNPGQPGGNSSISLIEVEKNVVMTAPDESASGDNGTYDVDNHMIKLNSHVVLVKNKNIVKGDRLEYNLETGKSQVFASGDKTKPNGRVESVFVPKQNDEKTDEHGSGQ